MIRRSPIVRAATVIAFTGAIPLVLMGCPKKTPEAVDSGPATVAEVDAAPVVLAPLDDDAGDAAEAEAPKHATHPWNPNKAHIQQCCNALRKQFGTAPEAAALVNSCDTVAAQTTGTAPEFAMFRQLLQGRTLPAACQGL